ncbi:MAG: hypothetical protein IKR01_00890, partial [Spirochaetales bacterium]|nr:hypothetical protein [Spirochaetales bacterium]
AAAAFATSGDQLKLTASVDKILPQFQISTVDSASAAKIGTAAGVEVTTGKDIAEEPITWDFDVEQKGEKDKKNNTKTYAKYNNIVELTLTLGNFTATIDGATYTEAGTPTVDSVDLEDKNEANTSLNKIAIATTTDGKGIKLTYSGKVVDQKFGTFTCTWPKDDTLPVGTYTANVTLNYSVQ